MTKINLYTDGACQKNPGGEGGYGVVLVDEEGVVLDSLKGYMQDPTTSNRAEITAVIFGLIRCIQLGFDEVIIYSDSEYVVKTMNNGWRKKKNLDLWQQLNIVSEKLSCEYIWVKGHADNEYNNLADSLARDGAARIFI